MSDAGKSENPADTGELDAGQRDALFRDCAHALELVDEGDQRLFLARLVLLLFEQVGDADRCRQAIEQARDGLRGPG